MAKYGKAISWATVSMLVLTALLVCSVAVIAAPGGPCCQTDQGSSGQWGSAERHAGPRYVCRTVEKIMLQYNGNTYPVDAIEARQSLLVPARVFGVTGAKVDWSGGRNLVVALGARTVNLTLGEHKVGIVNDGQPSSTSWALCPRLRNDIAYVPLRQMANSLGFSIKWAGRTATLENGEAAAAGSGATAECPASKVETVLGITVVRGMAGTPFGTGVGVVEVKSDGNGARLGLKPKDVILAANGKRISCPRDLEALMAQSEDGNTPPCALTIVRDGVKMNLKCASKTP